VKLKLGFVGLGKMGQALALRAIQSGYTVYGYNRTKSKVDSIRDRVEILPSISDVVEKSDVILVTVTDDEADEDVILGNHGISDYIRPNKMIIDFSTISPIMSKYINEKLKRKNAYRLEVPLIGGPAKALRGELIALIGGDRSKYEEMSDLIKTFAIRTIYAGNIGDALSLKLAFNLLVAGYAELIAEGLAFVQKMKVDPRLFVYLVNASGYKTEFSETKGQKMLVSNYEPTFYLKHMKKDLGLISKVADKYNVYLPVHSTLWSTYTAATEYGLAEEDYSAILEYLLKINKLKE
jgi:3-hydroxyisobutyrate dehydrogenase-like beta-hydroxyacid dehydrogenase